MVRHGDDLQRRIDLLTEKASRDNMKFLIQDFHDRYSSDEINRICSGDNWDNAEALLANTIGMAMEMIGPLLLGPLADLVGGLITSAVHGAMVFTFILGYEKAKSEALAKDLGLEDDHDG